MTETLSQGQRERYLRPATGGATGLIQTDSMPAPETRRRATPYPFRAMLAICSDVDETPDRRVYADIMRFLNTGRDTAMGPGVGLEVGNSIYFDMPAGQFAYWNTDEAGREMIRTLIRDGGLEDRGKLLGKVPYEDILTELTEASVFILASWEENSPISIEEAMAVGLPVVTSNRGGMPYMVRDGESGFLVDPNDPRDIARRLGQLLADDALREARAPSHGRLPRIASTPRKWRNERMMYTCARFAILTAPTDSQEAGISLRPHTYWGGRWPD